jgi:hypothetical protein
MAQIDASDWVANESVPEIQKRPRIKKRESERRKFKPFSQRNNSDQESRRLLLLCSAFVSLIQIDFVFR